MTDDATSDALRRMAEDGSDLSRPLRMDFFVAVPDRASGDVVAARAAAIERQLDELAGPVGGRADGFGSFGNADEIDDEAS